MHIGSRNWADGEVWYHTGSNVANYSTAFVGPNAGIVFLVVINRGDNQGITDEAASEMTGKLLKYWHEYI